MIIYSLVARGTLILAEYTSFDGDFPTVARKILAKAEKSKMKKTMWKDNFAFTFFSEDEFTFLCMTKTSVSREISFKFLDRLAQLFYSERRKQDDTKSWSAHFSVKMKQLMVRA
jgi:hypothetical protein